uniref:Uncharacterized protein n=1 Tax=Anopheles culicifacies TaxID=139723 RepID=A0A182MTT0_9DIPT
MHAPELLILLLTVQQLTTAYQRNSVECAKSRPSYRVQRVWRSGSFRFDSAQFEPTRWEWQRNAKTQVSINRPRPVSRNKPEVEHTKLLWKVENQHEDYDSLMSSEDDVPVSPKQSLSGLAHESAGHHDNVGTRMVKMVDTPSDSIFTTESPAEQISTNALYSEEEINTNNRTWDVTEKVRWRYNAVEVDPVCKIDLTLSRHDDDDDEVQEVEESPRAGGIFSWIYHSICTLFRSILEAIVYLFTDSSSSNYLHNSESVTK